MDGFFIRKIVTYPLCTRPHPRCRGNANSKIDRVYHILFLDAWTDAWLDGGQQRQGVYPSLWLISSQSGKGAGKKIAFWGVYPPELFLSFYVTTYLAREKILNGKYINKDFSK